MTYKWTGAVLILLACGGAGFSIAAGYRRQERLLRQLIQILDYMESELQYHLTPLPELCRQAGKEADGMLRNVFLALARELDWQSAPDAGSCMAAAIRQNRDLPAACKGHLFRLGQVLGRFDLPGQLQGLRGVQQGCEESLARLAQDREGRLRSYRTLGVCAGAALVILLA